LAARSLATWPSIRMLAIGALAQVDMTKVPAAFSCRSGKREHEPPHPLRLGCAPRGVGDFTCVETAALRFTFAAAVQGTWLDWLETRRSPPLAPARPACLGCSGRLCPRAGSGLPLHPCCDRPMEVIIAAASLRSCFCRLQPLASVCLRLSLQVPPPFLALDPMHMPLSDTLGPQLGMAANQHQGRSQP